MRRISILAAAIICLACAGTATAADSITAKQKAASESFIKALMKSDYKEAYKQFSPKVRDRYPFPIFSDIQSNIKNTIGTPVSFALRKPAGSGSCIYDLVYAQNAKKTAIPLQLTFTPDDPEGKIESINFMKDQMKEIKK